MQQEADHPVVAPAVGKALDYAPRSLRPRHSFFSILALVMACISVLWLGYIRACLGTTPHWQTFNPLWVALYDNYQWPGEIGIALAVVGLIPNSRKRKLSIIAVVIIVITYVLLLPTGNFA
jgi:hypothetical protein